MPIIGKKLAVTWKSWTFCASRSPVRFTSSHAYAARSSKECTSFFQSKYVAGAIGVRSCGPKPAPPSLATRASTRATNRSEFSNGTGCIRNASARLNIAAFAPIPRASASTQTIVAIRCLSNIRMPNRTSCQSVCINLLFVSQRNKWINARSSPCRHVTGRQRSGHQEQVHRHENERVPHLPSVHHSFKQSRQHQRCRDTQPHAHGDKP